MAYLIKGLLFFIVFVWIMKGISRVFLGGLFRQAQQRGFQQQQQQGPSAQQRPTGNIHVNQSPNKESRKNKTSDDFRGGDYIEYEEVD